MSAIYPFALCLAVSVPLALALMGLARPLRPMAARLAPWAATPALFVALLASPGLVVDLRWIVLGTRLGLDSIGQIFLFFTALLWGMGGVFGRAYVTKDPHRFFFFYLLAMAGNFGLVLALDAPAFYVCFALMSFASYGLVIHNRDAEALRAGRIYIGLVVLGEVLLFAALVIIAVSSGTTRLPLPAGAQIPHLAIGLAVAGFGIKAGLVPLHVWLPLAHPVAPTPASAVLSGAMIKAGLLGWLRFLPLGQNAQMEWGNLLILVGLAGACLGVAVGVTQRNPKTVLAYSSISQMGLMILALGAGMRSPEGWAAAQMAVVLFALHHGLAKGALFLGVGVAQAANSRARAWTGIGLVLPALALAGAPLTSGAVVKSMLKSAADALPETWTAWLGALLQISAVGTALLMARFLFVVWPRKTGEGHLSAGMWIPWGVLVGAVLVTFLAWPPAAGHVGKLTDVSAAWSATWPVLAGAIMSFGIWRWRRQRPRFPAIPAGDLLALGERVSAVLRCRWRIPAVGAVWAKAVDRTGGWLARLAGWIDRGAVRGRCEEGLQRWAVAGVVFVVLAALFALLLAPGR